MRNTSIMVTEFVDPTLQNVDGVVDNVSKGPHRRLSPTIGLSLTPDLIQDGRIEAALASVLSLLFEYIAEFLLGEEGLLIVVVRFEGGEYFL
jgi:hypothetical protein